MASASEYMKIKNMSDNEKDLLTAGLIDSNGTLTTAGNDLLNAVLTEEYATKMLTAYTVLNGEISPVKEKK